MRSILTALLAFLLAPSCLVAQKTEADLRARLINKPLYLRGEWSGDKLAFDSAGDLKGTSAPGSFTLSGIEIKSVTVTSTELVLDGQRVGLEFAQNVPHRIGLVVRGRFGAKKPEAMTLEIEAPANGDFTAALDAMFADGISDLVPQLPPFWQPFAQRYLLTTGTAAPQVRSVTPAATGGGPIRPSGRLKPPDGLTAPRLLTKVDPDFSEAARALPASGISVVNFVLDTNGKPSHLRIVSPIGLGLDEQAVSAVSRYTFQPAMQNGSPVPVELNVEVNFQIF
jgi:TonB family protein